MSIVEGIVWESKYRPQSIDECILPKATKDYFKGMVKNGEFPNMLLSGPAGTGKTTAARALCRELDYELLVINGSNQGRLMDTLRSKVTNFASQMSLTGQNKCVLIDEADFLPQETIQPALRNFMDEFANANVKFILTCNYPNKILEPLRSRCANIDFKIPTEESLQLMSEAVKRIKYILAEEKITIDSDTILLKLVRKYFPDMRRLVNEVQYKTSSGVLASDALTGVVNSGFTDLSKYLAAKDAKSIRNWVATQPYLSIDDIIQDLYNNMDAMCSKETMAQFIATIADWSYKSNFMPDKELAIVAMMVELILTTEIHAIKPK